MLGILVLAAIVAGTVLAVRKTLEAANLAAEPPASDPDLTADIKKIPIIVYTTKTCPVCRMARDYLRTNRIPFTEIDVEQNSDAQAAVRMLNPNLTVPTFDIGGEALAGFSPERFEATLRRASRRRVGR